MPTLVTPGAVGLPANVKEQGKRVDFRPNDFVLAIETKGYRLAWSRVSLCPCTPLNDQTDQSNPNCVLCEGSGWLKFKPNSFAIDTKIVGDLDALQLKIIGSNSVVIRGVMSGFNAKDNPYESIGRRLEGTSMVSVRHENKLGYHDRLVNLDSTIPYSQVLEAGDPAVALTLSYPARQINLLRSESTLYSEGSDFDLVAGDIVWSSAMGANVPDEGTRLACHYDTHPAWRVVEHPHALRLTPVKYKTTTPGGDPTPLPVQATVKYEFLL